MVRSPWLRLRLAAALFFALVATMPREFIVIGPPRAVVTRNPKMGVHTRLSDEPDAWKVRATLRLVREMGAPWIVEFFPWPYYEPGPGAYNWGHADLIVNLARAEGLTVIARLGAVPDWARPRDRETNWNYLDEAHYDDYARFVEAFVRHFDGRVDYIIILNEPNLTREWGFRPVDPAGYAAVLRRAYTRAKAANPAVQVLAGALAPTLEPQGSAMGLNDLLFLERLYQAGFADSFDILAVHAYGLSRPPSDPPDPEVLNFRRAELLRAIMVRYGDERKPVMITEAGWNDQPRWLHGVRPSQRVRYTLEAYAAVQRDWPWAAVAAMWVFKYPQPFYNYLDNYAFVAPDLTPRVIYDEVRSYSQGRPPP
jgi:hypothetical protein